MNSFHPSSAPLRYPSLNYPPQVKAKIFTKVDYSDFL